MSLSSRLQKPILLFLALFVTLSGKAVIYEVKTMDEVMAHFQCVTSNDLAVFDVDGVLIVPQDPALQFHNFKYYGLISLKVLSGLSKMEKEIFYTLIDTTTDAVLLDQKVLSLFNMLKEREVKAIALSALLSGSFGEVDSLQERRYLELKRLGIDFLSTFPCPEEITFDQFPAYRNNYAVLHKGIILSNGSYNPTTKGDVLAAFLSITQLKVESLYFVEDTAENLTIVEEKLKRVAPSVHFVGLHYTAAYQPKHPTVDAVTFERRFKELAVQARELSKKAT